MEWLSVQTNSTYLVKQWATSTKQGLTGAIVCSVLLSLLHEILGSYIKAKKKLWNSHSLHGSGNFSMAFQHCVLAVVYIFKVLVGYLLIFAVLTYNTWILLSIGFSAGLGYLVIRPLVSYLSHRKTGQYTLNNGDIEEQPLFYKVQTPTENRICPLIQIDTDDNIQATDETFENERQWEQLREMYRRASESRRFIDELKSRRSGEFNLNQTSFSTGNVLQWHGDFNETLASESETNMWIQDASWDATLDMLESGYVGRDESFNNTFNTVSLSEKLVTMHVSVV